jgi:mono/diheme cytochrome c family protein
MKLTILALTIVLSAMTPVAYAQQMTSGLDGTQVQGRNLLAQSCGICHLQPAMGAKTYGPPLNRATAAGNDEAIRVIVVNGTERMPAFKYYLKPAEIDAIIAYLKTVPAPAAVASTESKGASQ